jgi:hypothetical protein
LLRRVSNPVLDSSRLLDQSVTCDARCSLVCDPEFDQKLKAAGELEGDARDRASQDIWAYMHEEYCYMPLFGLDYVKSAGFG